MFVFVCLCGCVTKIIRFNILDIFYISFFLCFLNIFMASILLRIYDTIECAKMYLHKKKFLIKFSLYSNNMWEFYVFPVNFSGIILYCKATIEITIHIVWLLLNNSNISWLKVNRLISNKIQKPKHSDLFMERL